MGAIPRRWTMVFFGPALLPLAACDSRQDTTDEPRTVRVVTVPTIAPTRPAPRLDPAPAKPTLTLPIAAPPPQSLAEMRPRKAFVDPPLPPELRDDGGLRPLPQRAPQ